MLHVFPPTALQSAEPARTVGHKMCRTALAVLLLCSGAARSAELTVSPAYADVRGGQPLLLTLPAGTRWDLEEPHCLIGERRVAAVPLASGVVRAR